MIEYEGLDVMTRQFLNTALWTASCNGQATHEGCLGEDCDASLYDLGHEAMELPTYEYETARRVCNDFVALVRHYRPDVLDGMDPSDVGHDFLLTAQGHGAGFWDRGLGERGDYLTKYASTFHIESPYIGDDGYVHWDH